MGSNNSSPHSTPIGKKRIISYQSHVIFFSEDQFFIIKRFADLIIVVNPLLKRALEKQGFSPEKIKLNFNGINVNYFKNLMPNTRRSYYATFLGRLHPSKGIFDLISMWEEVCKEKIDAKLAIIGGGDERIKDELKRKIKKTRLHSNIEILGYLEDNEAFRLIKASKVFVFPSYEEGFGIAALKAMACGVPVVAWDLPVYREVFPEGMIKVPIGNVKKFADEVLRLQNDQHLYKEMKKDAISIASKYDWDRVAEREIELIKKLLDGQTYEQ